jgi:hypothetical protein
LPGDFNGDGKVSAADSTIWMDTLHSTTDLRADANGDGMVDYADREIWMAHFGMTTDVLPAVAGGASAFSASLIGEESTAPGEVQLAASGRRIGESAPAVGTGIASGAHGLFVGIGEAGSSRNTAGRAIRAHVSRAVSGVPRPDFEAVFDEFGASRTNARPIRELAGQAAESSEGLLLQRSDGAADDAWGNGEEMTDWFATEAEEGVWDLLAVE